MKILLSVSLLLALLNLTSCKKDSGTNSTSSGAGVSGKPVTATVTVLKDCSGDFLRYNGKDYRVCSLTQFRDYPDGATVKATFTIVNKCGQLDIFCSAALYTRTAWADVTAIK